MTSRGPQRSNSWPQCT